MKALALAASLLVAAWPLSALSQQDAKKSQQKTQKTLSKEDRQRFQRLARDNMAEIELGKLAQQKAASPDVKKFGEHMVEDHGELLEEQKKLAEKKNVKMPQGPNKEQQQAKKKLEGLSGEKFDQAYMQQMVKDHEKALKLVQDTAKNARDPQLKQMAQKAAPDIKEHLQAARDLRKAAAAGASSAGKAKK